MMIYDKILKFKKMVLVPNINKIKSCREKILYAAPINLFGLNTGFVTQTNTTGVVEGALQRVRAMNGDTAGPGGTTTSHNVSDTINSIRNLSINNNNNSLVRSPGTAPRASTRIKTPEKKNVENTGGSNNTVETTADNTQELADRVMNIINENPGNNEINVNVVAVGTEVEGQLQPEQIRANGEIVDQLREMTDGINQFRQRVQNEAQVHHDQLLVQNEQAVENFNNVQGNLNALAEGQEAQRAQLQAVGENIAERQEELLNVVDRLNQGAQAILDLINRINLNQVIVSGLLISVAVGVGVGITITFFRGLRAGGGGHVSVINNMPTPASLPAAGSGVDYNEVLNRVLRSQTNSTGVPENLSFRDFMFWVFGLVTSKSYFRHLRK